MKVIPLIARIRANVHAIKIWLSLYNYYFMRNLYATVPYFATLIYFSFMLTKVSPIIVANNLNFGGMENLCLTVLFTHPEEDRQVGLY